MNILFDIGHPADFYLFLHVRKLLEEQGVKTFTLLRDKEINHQLAEVYGVDYIKGTSQKELAGNPIKELWKWIRLAKKAIKSNKIDLLVSAGSPAGGIAAKFAGIPHYVFNDTEIACKQRKLYFAKKIFTPESYLLNLGPRHIRYNGIHELAYLNPEYFTPDPEVRKELGLKENEEYAVLRFVSWEASHDWGKKATSEEMQLKLFEKLADRYKVFISAEAELPEELEKFRLPIKPHRFHDALAFSSLVVSDGASTAAEAAVLGVQSLYVSSLAESLGYIKQLANTQLLHTSISLEEANKFLQNIIKSPLSNVSLQDARNIFLKNSGDVSQFICQKCSEHIRKQ